MSSVVKRSYALKWKANCGPNIVSKIEKERNNCGKWYVEWNGGAIHEVFCDNLMVHVREAYTVTLRDHSYYVENGINLEFLMNMQW